MKRAESQKKCICDREWMRGCAESGQGSWDSFKAFPLLRPGTREVPLRSWRRDLRVSSQAGALSSSVEHLNKAS